MVVLPAATHYETEGVYVSMNGRAQRLRPGATPPEGAAPGWELLIALAHRLGAPPPYRTAARAFAARRRRAPGARRARLRRARRARRPGRRRRARSRPTAPTARARSPAPGCRWSPPTRIFGNAATYRSDALAAVRTGAELVLNPAEAARLGLADGGAARLRSPHGECTLTVRTRRRPPRGRGLRRRRASPAPASSGCCPPTAAPCGSR